MSPMVNLPIISGDSSPRKGFMVKLPFAVFNNSFRPLNLWRACRISLSRTSVLFVTLIFLFLNSFKVSSSSIRCLFFDGVEVLKFCTSVWFIKVWSSSVEESSSILESKLASWWYSDEELSKKLTAIPELFCSNWQGRKRDKIN